MTLEDRTTVFCDGDQCGPLGRNSRCEHSRIDGDVPAARIAALQQQRPRWDKSTGHEQGGQKARVESPSQSIVPGERTASTLEESSSRILLFVSEWRAVKESNHHPSLSATAFETALSPARHCPYSGAPPQDSNPETRFLRPQCLPITPAGRYLLVRRQGLEPRTFCV